MPYWRLFYHITWATRNRECLIDAAWEGALHNLIAAKAAQFGGIVHAVGGTESHIHLVVSVPPGVTLSRFAGQVKGASSRFVNQAFRPARDFAWQAEYGVVSFGPERLDAVVRYAKQQRQHHLHDELDLLLERTEPDDSA